MHLSCPECAAEYDVPDAALDAARRLRCSACGTSWEWSPLAAAPQAPAGPAAQAAEAPPQPPAREPTPAEALAAPEAAPRIEMAPERRMAPAAPPPPQPRHRVMLAWAASLAIIVVALAALYVWRVPVMRAWPPATRLYAALGLA